MQQDLDLALDIQVDAILFEKSSYMCGLAGFWQPGSGRNEELQSRVHAMTSSIEHRGPDDVGAWCDETHGIGLGFRRLSILDLSEAGHQPMTSQTGRYEIVFNGEVYNHGELRVALKGHVDVFHGHSDTEVLLAAFETWGVLPALRRFNGMFAIALWDRELKRLYLTRDRMGIKPLFVQQTPRGLLFGSELKALRAHPEFLCEIDPDGVGEYLEWLYVAAPRTVLKNTYKVMPGQVLTVTNPCSIPDSVPFWSLGSGDGTEDVCSSNLEEATDQLEDLLRDAVGLRMVADVPLGALLSGGVDSSVIVGLMQSQSSRSVKTFSIGFDQEEHDESHHAQRVAQHLGTDHTPFHLTSQDALEVVPDLPAMFDEPLADPSQIPTYLVSRMARQDVTVALSGDGGDELFGGYNRYRFGPKWARGLSRIPSPFRHALGRGLQAPSAQTWDRFSEGLMGRIPGVSAPRLFGEKVGKLGAMALASGVPDMLESLSTVGWDAREVGTRGFFADAHCRPRPTGLPGTSQAEWMMASDQTSYLPDDLLAKVDRASMAVSLEVRVPILDHHVVEFSWRVPEVHKFGPEGGKTILKKVLYRYVPQEIVDRPKVGFTPPVAEWLRTGLRPWAEDLLAQDHGAMGVVWDFDVVQGRWKEFQKGHRRHTLGLWALIQFQAWFEGFKAGD